LWRPYWLAKRHIPDWLPLRPSWRVINFLKWGADHRRRRRR
jgi:hypothetical protein